MKTLAAILALAASACLAARIETISIDLERPQQPFVIPLTEATDSTVSAQLLASGSEFDPTGWTGLLWYGTTAGGYTLTNSASGYGLMTWSIPVYSMPTNGRYSVQILGAISNRVEEWGRGAMIVRMNPSRDYLPAQWITNSPAYSTALQALALASMLPSLLSNTVAALPPPTGAPIWYDAADSNYFATVRGGTGLVWKVTIPVIGTGVVVSAGFNVSGLFPPVLNGFPFYTNNFTGAFDYGGYTAMIRHSGPGISWGTYGTTYPMKLIPVTVYAQGTATVDLVYGPATTNLYTRIASTNDLSRYATLDAWVASTNLLNDQIIAVNNNAAMIAAHTNRTDNPHGTTAAQIGALSQVNTNAFLTIGSTNTTIAKVYVNGEAGAYTNKPLLQLNRSATGTGKLQVWSTNGTEVASVNTTGQWTGDGSQLTGISAGLSATAATNIANAVSSYLSSTFTNATGVTTAQVWRVGGGTVTNFFSSVTYTDSLEWTRPLNWPVGLGYTAETWTTPETNMLKMVFIGDICTVFRVVGASYSVDWYGDGSVVSNYSSLQSAQYSYPATYLGKFIAIKAVATSPPIGIQGFGYGVSTLIPNGKFSTVREVIAPISLLSQNIAINNASELKYVHCGNSKTLSLVGSSSTKKIIGPDIKILADSAMYMNTTIDSITFPSVTNAYNYAFYCCFENKNLDIPNMETIGSYFCYGSSALSIITPMPNLKSVGLDAFSLCNLSFTSITNFILNLTNNVSANPQTINFRCNPGITDGMIWYTNGAPSSASNALSAKGWFIKWQ